MYAGLFTIITIITRSSMYYFWTVDKTFLSLSLSTMYSRQDHDGKNMHESVVYTIKIVNYLLALLKLVNPRT
jgi:hypothetical protein